MLGRKCGHFGCLSCLSCLNHVRFLAETPGGFAAWRLTALVAGELADYALGLRPRPHTAGDPLGPKAIRTSAFDTGGLACYEATLQNLPERT